MAIAGMAATENSLAPPHIMLAPQETDSPCSCLRLMESPSTSQELEVAINNRQGGAVLIVRSGAIPVTTHLED